MWWTPEVMRNDDRVIVSGLVLLMLVLWLGFVLHRSPDFAGSAWGGVFAVSGAMLMLVPLAYALVKRIGPLRRTVTAHLSMGRFLQVHIYGGLVGAILVIVHTGHKFQSTLGIALTTMTLLVVLSGFVGRYLLGFIAEDARDRRNRLEVLRAEYRRVAAELEQTPAMAPQVAALPAAGAQALPLVESIADLEYGLSAEERLRRFFALWLRFHLLISSILYGLLGLHVWAAIEFGLRWFA